MVFPLLLIHIPSFKQCVVLSDSWSIWQMSPSAQDYLDLWPLASQFLHAPRSSVLSCYEGKIWPADPRNFQLLRAIKCFFPNYAVFNRKFITFCFFSLSSGSFRECHDGVAPDVDPVNFYAYCQYDLCAMWPNEFALCTKIETYDLACREAGVETEEWRTDNFCGKSSVKWCCNNYFKSFIHSPTCSLDNFYHIPH